MDWFRSQSDQLKKARIEIIRSQGRVIAEEQKESQANIMHGVSQDLKESRRKMLDREDKERERYEGFLEGMFEHGGLWSAEAVKEEVENINAKGNKIKALKAQINVWTKILKVAPTQEVLLTKATIAELCSHLENLCKLPIPEESHDLYELILNPKSLNGMSFVQRWVEGDQIKFYSGSIIEFIEQDPKLLEFKIL